MKKKCDFCKNKLPESPAIVKTEDHEFVICEECEMLFQVLHDKMQERLDDEYESL